VAMVIIGKSNVTVTGIAFAFYGGPVYETGASNGLFHLCEHLITGQAESSRRTGFVSAIESIGGVSGGFTSKDSVVLYAKVPYNEARKTTARINRVLNELSTKRKISEGAIAAEKRVIEAEIASSKLSIERNITHQWWRCAYEGHPLALPPIGSLTSIQQINPAEVRSTLETYFNPDSAMVVVIENATSRRRTDGLKFHSVSGQQTGVNRPRLKEATESSRLEIVSKDGNSVHIGLGFMGLQQDDRDTVVLELIGTLLGGGIQSRLIQKLRYQNSLLYKVVVIREHYCCGGSLLFSGSCSLRDVEVIVGVIINELRKLRQGDICPEELTRVKRYLDGRVLLRNSDVLTNSATIARRALYNCNLDAAYRKGYRLIRTEDVMRAAKRVFKPTRLTVVFVGPIGQTQAERVFQMGKERLVES